MAEFRKVRVNKATKATRQKIKASIGIDGLSGNGKTGLALELSAILADNDFNKIYVADAENNSALQYVGRKLYSGTRVPKEEDKTFHHSTLDNETGYSPFNYQMLQQEAKELGCEVFIQDTYSNMWNRKDGVLDMKSQVEAHAKQKVYRDSYGAWGHPDVMEGKNLIFDLVRSQDMHIISTMRVKDDIVRGFDETKNRTTIEKVGVKQIQSDGLDYEFDLVLRVIRPANVEKNTPTRIEVSKSRYDILQKGEEYDITTGLLESIKEYLKEGVDASVLNERQRVEMAEDLKRRAQEKPVLVQVFKKRFGEDKDGNKRKIKDLTLKELRELNSRFISIENN